MDFLLAIAKVVAAHGELSIGVIFLLTASTAAAQVIQTDPESDSLKIFPSRVGPVLPGLLGTGAQPATRSSYAQLDAALAESPVQPVVEVIAALDRRILVINTIRRESFDELDASMRNVEFATV